MVNGIIQFIQYLVHKLFVDYSLVAHGELMSYSHKGFWQCMDNVRERDILEQLYAKNIAPWKKW